MSTALTAPARPDEASGWSTDLKLLGVDFASAAEIELARKHRRRHEEVDDKEVIIGFVSGWGALQSVIRVSLAELRPFEVLRLERWERSANRTWRRRQKLELDALFASGLASALAVPALAVEIEAVRQEVAAARAALSAEGSDPSTAEIVN